jgi:hypothetical protein
LPCAPPRANSKWPLRFEPRHFEPLRMGWSSRRRKTNEEGGSFVMPALGVRACATAPTRPSADRQDASGQSRAASVLQAFTGGAKLVKGFNHLVAAALAADPIVEGGTGSSFCRATTRTRPLPWRPWPNNSGSRPSSWESSTRVARWCTRAAALGVSSSSRIYSGRSSNRSTTV